MNPELRELADEYARALENYLVGRGEAALQEAYDLGRKTLAKGLGVLDVSTLQHRALLKCLLRARTAKEGSRILSAANKLFVESLLPFEMSHRRVQEVNTALRESEQRYRNLVDTARDVIYTLSLDGKIKSLNPVFETITGWPRAEWIGREFPLLVHPDDLPRAVAFFKAVLDGRVPPTFELRVVTKSGAYVPGEFMATPLSRAAPDDPRRSRPPTGARVPRRRRLAADRAPDPGRGGSGQAPGCADRDRPVPHRPGSADQRDEACPGDPRDHQVRAGGPRPALHHPRQRHGVRCPRGAGAAGCARPRPHRDPGTTRSE